MKLIKKYQEPTSGITLDATKVVKPIVPKINLDDKFYRDLMWFQAANEEDSRKQAKEDKAKGKGAKVEPYNVLAHEGWMEVNPTTEELSWHAPTTINTEPKSEGQRMWESPAFLTALFIPTIGMASGNVSKAKALVRSPKAYNAPSVTINKVDDIILTAGRGAPDYNSTIAGILSKGKWEAASMGPKQVYIRTLPDGKRLIAYSLDDILHGGIEYRTYPKAPEIKLSSRILKSTLKKIKDKTSAVAALTPRVDLSKKATRLEIEELLDNPYSYLRRVYDSKGKMDPAYFEGYKLLVSRGKLFPVFTKSGGMPEARLVLEAMAHDLLTGLLGLYAATWKGFDAHVGRTSIVPRPTKDGYNFGSMIYSGSTPEVGVNYAYPGNPIVEGVTAVEKFGKHLSPQHRKAIADLMALIEDLLKKNNLKLSANIFEELADPFYASGTRVLDVEGLKRAAAQKGYNNFKLNVRSNGPVSRSFEPITSAKPEVVKLLVEEYKKLNTLLGRDILLVGSSRSGVIDLSLFNRIANIDWGGGSYNARPLVNFKTTGSDSFVGSSNKLVLEINNLGYKAGIILNIKDPLMTNDFVVKVPTDFLIARKKGGRLVLKNQYLKS